MIGRILVGLVFIVLGLVVGGVFVRWGLWMVGTTTLTCQRIESNQVNCTIEEYHWLGLSYETTQLTHVKKADRESYSCGSRKGRKTCYDLVIQTESGDIHPTNVLGTGLVNDMNQFLASTQPTWVYSTGKLEWIMGIIMALLGAVVGPIFVLIGLSLMFGTATPMPGTESP